MGLEDKGIVLGPELCSSSAGKTAPWGLKEALGWQNWVFPGGGTFSPSAREQKGQQLHRQYPAAPLLLQHWSRVLGRQDHYEQT